MDNLLKIAKPYGVVGINFGGCVSAQAKGFKGSMRRKAHAHCQTHNKWRGWICFLSLTPERRAISKNGKPSHLFWHEVAHIRRRSWTEKQCDKWAWQQVHSQ